MINGFKVITLCGSTRFKEEFLEAQKRLTLEGNIVISVGLFGHSGDDVVWTEGVKDMLDRQHLAKIDLADEIYVINVGGYIGDSTRREIAYAEFKGKSISYLEECKKTSIYDNSNAIVELHDSGKLSDEDWEKACRDFDEKREALIAEFNACQGPWPYQWENIDAVVCGILQQFGPVSIDYYDLKYLYETDMLRSSEKLAVTIIGPSNPAAYFIKTADFFAGMDVVWQTRKTFTEGKEMELSIIYSVGKHI